MSRSDPDPDDGLPAPGHERRRVCPCGCGHRPPSGLMACAHGWRRLPGQMRGAISDSPRGSTRRLRAVNRALGWWREHPPLP